MKKALLQILIGLIILAIGTTFGLYYGEYTTQQSRRLIEIRENSNQYTYINPLLLVTLSDASPKYLDLKKKVENYIESSIKNKKAESISIYFNDLNLGEWTGVNEMTLYDPASTLKVAVLLGYLKKAESSPDSLTDKLHYIAVNDPGQHYPPEHSLASGYYTVKELLAAMIIDSDNNALTTLYNHNRDDFVVVLKNLNISPPPSTTELDFISPRTYSRIFRTLYSSTYLPRSISEQALELLTYTTFKKGLVAGLPDKTVVAHKFGEHTDTNSSGKILSHQLHDCGIVYFPEKPYFLCIMTKGDNFENLERVISDISRLTYQYRKDT